MVIDSGKFGLWILRNQLRIALSINSKLTVLSFVHLMLLPFSSESNSFSLFLTQVDKVFLGRSYLTATSSLLVPFFPNLQGLDIFHVMFGNFIYVFQKPICLNVNSK